MNLSSILKQDDTNLLEQICGVFARHIDAEPHHIVGTALWAIHTHIYRKYDKSPRLAILSPVPNCGKSTVLNILQSIVAQPRKVIDPTVASTFRLAGSHTLLLDEVDNMGLIRNMKAIINSGHEVGGVVPRVGPDKEIIEYLIYGPLALASIGSLPVTIMSRSLIIPMYRSSTPKEVFNSREEFYSKEIARWAEKVNLDLNPRLPPQITGRDADKWRPLIAIGNALDRSKIAYETMLEFYKEGTVTDIKESLLRDIKQIFDKTKKDMHTTDYVYQMLLEDLESDYEADYSEHKLTKAKIARMLRAFKIENRVYWHKGRATRCWFKEDFEKMWKRFV